MDDFSSILELIAGKGPSPRVDVYHVHDLMDRKYWVVRANVNCGDCFEEKDFDKSWDNEFEGGFEMETKDQSLKTALEKMTLKLSTAHSNMISLEELRKTN